MIEQPNAMSAIVFDAMSGIKKLTNIISVTNCTNSAFNPSVQPAYEASFAEVGQVIAGRKLFVSFLMPDMASKTIC